MNQITVVVTTYNGEKYIEEQLESIRTQTLSPDEVLILDDCSRDKTVQISKDYIERYNLTGWSVIENEQNQGWKKNFYNGFCRATGTYIFPCDQDDIWDNDKIQIMIKEMDTHPEVLVLCSNYHIFYSEEDTGSGAYDRQNKQMKNDGSLRKIELDPKWAYILRPGCTFCFRKTFFDMIKGEWDTSFAHDAILWRYSCAMDGLAIINLPLIKFRRHGNNSTSGNKWTKKNRIETFEQYLWFHQKVKPFIKNCEYLKIIDEGIHFLEKRIVLYKSRNLLLWIYLFLRYREWYLSFKGCLADLKYGVLQ